MAYQPALLGLAALAAYLIYRIAKVVFAPTKLWNIAGPPNAHWMMGNMRETFNAEQSAVHEQWAARYGHVLIYRGMFGVRTAHGCVVVVC
jgi:hypothetical protein